MLSTLSRILGNLLRINYKIYMQNAIIRNTKSNVEGKKHIDESTDITNDNVTTFHLLLNRRSCLCHIPVVLQVLMCSSWLLYVIIWDLSMGFKVETLENTSTSYAEKSLDGKSIKPRTPIRSQEYSRFLKFAQSTYAVKVIYWICADMRQR